MSTLLERAKIYLDHASYDIQKAKEDDLFISHGCTEVQQSLEFTLKYLVTLHGKSYNEGHYLTPNIKEVYDDEEQIQPLLDKLLESDVLLKDWYIKSRYNDDFLALLRDLQKFFDIASELLNYVSSKVTTREITDDELYELIPPVFKTLFKIKEECVAAWKAAHPNK